MPEIGTVVPQDFAVQSDLRLGFQYKRDIARPGTVICKEWWVHICVICPL